MSLNTQPSNSIIERLRGLFQRRVRDSIFAVLGDKDGAGARVDVPGRKGYVYVRFPGGRNVNGFTNYSAPMMARSAGAAFPNTPGFGVYVTYGDNGELEIKSAHYQSLDNAGINTSILNPLNQQSKWVYPWQLTYGLALAVATSATSSFLVTVKSFRHYVGNVFQTFETPEQADKIDLSSYIPIAGEHCYAAIWIDTYTNTASVTTSTAQSILTPMDETDIQELVTGRPADAMPLKGFYLANGQASLMTTGQETDLRQHMDTPQLWGFPISSTLDERVRPGYALVTAPYTTPVTIEAGGQVIIVHKNNWIATTAPTVNDDSGDGYTVGSVWFNKSTGLLYVAEDVTAGAAVWTVTNSGTSGAPSTAKYLLQQSDAGLPNAQAMGALATGLVKNTTTTGVQSIATAGTDYTSPTGTENLSNKTITASSLIATALSLLIGSFKGIFTHANTADRTYTFKDASGTVAFTSDITSPPFVDTQAIIKGSADATKQLRFEVDGFTTGTTRVMTPPNYDGTLATLAGTETLTSKTLTTPTIGDFTNATHNHSNAAGGGTLTGAAFGTQSANLAFIGPTTGSAANPTFRALIPNDLATGSALQYFRANAANNAIERATLPALTVDWKYYPTTASGPWSKPAGAVLVRVICVGGGGGGASGRRGATSTARAGGGGGAGGYVTEVLWDASQLGSSETITVGTGGTGGAGRAADNLSGLPGGDGNPSFFGGSSITNAKQMAAGGGGGTGGSTANGPGGTGATTFGSSVQFYGSDGGAGTFSAVGVTASVGGRGPGGGGGASGLSAANASANGGSGASGSYAAFPTATTGGGGSGGGAWLLPSGASGASATTDGTSAFLFGSGGGGGKNDVLGAYPGGAGGSPGGGGGGGAASLNGNASGNGGNGADGGVYVISYCYA